MKNEIKEWISVSDTSTLLQKSKRMIQLYIKEGKFEYKEVPARGGKQFLIKFDSLPDYAKLKYFRNNNLLPSSVPVQNNSKDILVGKAREVALAKFNLIAEWKQFRATTKLPKKKADFKFINDYKAQKYPEIYEVLKGKGSVKTLYRDSKLLDENNNNFEVLAPGYEYGNKGTKLSAEEVETLLTYIKYPTKLKPAEIVTSAIEELTENGFVNVRSTGTYLRWINQWKNRNYDLWTLHREGQKALNDKVAPYINRDKSLLEVGDMLVIDGHVLNFEIINPATGKPKRMMLVLVYDFRSDMPLGWEIMPTENKYSIAAALRRALIFLGVQSGLENSALKARVINIDNGRANKSKYLLGSTVNQLPGLFNKIADHVQIAKPYHGQTKTIERFFGTMSNLERLTITYSGTSIADKAPRLMRNEKLHANVYNRFMEGVVMDIKNAHLAIAEWFDKYAVKPHQDGFYKGRTPKDIFTESMEKIKSQPDFESRIITKQYLNFLLLEEKITTLYRNGILLNGEEYFSPEFYRLEKGKDKIDLIVKYDTTEADMVLVYDTAGNFICEATNKKKTHPLAKIYGNSAQLSEYEKQLQAHSDLTYLTTQQFKSHFENEVLPQLPSTIKKIEERAKAPKEIEDKNRNMKLDLSCDYEPTIDDEYDFKISDVG